MAYNPYMYGNPYYPQMQFQPMMNQPNTAMAQPAQQQNMAQPTQQINVVEVGSENEATGYLVAAGASVLLWWRAGHKFFWKSRDMNGSPYPMKTMSYTDDDEPTAPQATPEYITRDEFNGLVQKVNKLEQKPARRAKEAEPDV